MSDQGSEVPPPPPEPKLFKIFCSPIDTKIGEALVEKLENPYENNNEDKNIIIGSMCGIDRSKVPSGVRKIIDINDRSVLLTALKSCEVTILDIFKVDHKIVEYVIKTINYFDDGKHRTLILISSVKTWATTPPKEKKEGDEIEEEPADEGDQEPEEEEPAQEEVIVDADPEDPENEVVKKEYAPLLESNYELRRTYPCYRKHRSLESLCLAAQRANPNFTGFVVAAGALYGMGEEFLLPYFRQGWLQDPLEFDYYGEGKNKIPTIHYRDLAMHIKYILYKPPKRIRYVLAIDHTRKREQKRILHAISKGIGCGGMRKVEHNTSLHTKIPDYDLLTLDLWILSSKIFNEPKLEGEEEPEPEEEEDEEEEEDQQGENILKKKKKLKLKFDWWCKQGIARNIQKLSSEFNSTRGLRPNKIVVHGPPCSGSTYFASKLASFFNIPLLTIKGVIEQARKEIKGEFQEELQAHLDEQKEKMMEEEKERLEKLRAQGRLKMAEDEEIELDETKFVPRLSDDFLIRCFKWRLGKNDCLNRGYVLDSYPKNYKNARKLFMDIKEEDENDDYEPDEPSEEGADPEPQRVINNNIKPDSVILLRASKSYVMKFIDNMSEDEIQNTHYNEKDFDRRMRVWNKFNISNDGSFVLEDFYNQNLIDTIKVNLDKGSSGALKSIKIFLERNGKFENYQTHENDQEKERIQQAAAQMQEREAERLRLIAEREQKEKEDLLVQQEEIRLKMAKYRHNEAEIVKTHSQTLKTYFSKNMIEILKEGLLDLSNSMPEDPVDHLADFLFKNAHKVPELARGDI